MLFKVILVASFFLLHVYATEYTLFAEKPKPFTFEGEFDKTIAIRKMLDYKNIDYISKEYTRSEKKAQEQKSILGELPIVKIQEGRKELIIPYYRTAEREIAKKINLYPSVDVDFILIEEALEILNGIHNRWIFGQTIENGHNKWIFEDNFIMDWVSPAIKQLTNMSNTETEYFFTNYITIIEIKFYLLVNEFTPQVRQTLLYNETLSTIYEKIKQELESN